MATGEYLEKCKYMLSRRNLTCWEYEWKPLNYFRGQENVNIKMIIGD